MASPSLSFTLGPLNYSLHWGRLSQKNDNDDFLFSFRCPCTPEISEKYHVSARLFIGITTRSDMQARAEKTAQFSGKIAQIKRLRFFILFDEASPLLAAPFNRRQTQVMFSKKSVWPKIPMLYESYVMKKTFRESICKRESH